MDTQVITQELTKFNTTDAAIAVISKEYMALTISGLHDKDGLERVHKARIDVKTRRVAVTKKGKELREDAVRFQKSVIEEEKRIIGLLTPIEDHLTDEENRVEEEKERIRAEAERKEAERIQVRENRLLDMGCRFDRVDDTYSYDKIMVSVAMIKLATDEQFAELCAAIQTVIDAERKAKEEEAARIAKIAADQEAERLRLDAEAKRIKEEQDRIAAEQEKERQRLAVEAKKIQDEKDRIEKEKKAVEDARISEEQEKVRAAELEKAKMEAAERARIETEERLKREAEEKIAKEEKARIAAEKKAARRPDKVKLTEWLDNFNLPEMVLKTDEGRSVWAEMVTIMETAVTTMRLKVEAL